MQRSRIDIWVGSLVLLGALALLFVSLKAANLLSLNLQSGYMVKANFDNIGGVKPQAAVKSAGVVVGRVQNIGLDPQTYQAVVLLEIDRRYQFPKDSSLKILTSGLLGEQYIGIEPGADEKNLVDGDRIAQTQSALVLENLISQFLFNKAAESPIDTGK